MTDDGYLKSVEPNDPMTPEERIQREQNLLLRAQAAVNRSELRLLALEVEMDARLLRVSDRTELLRRGLLYTEQDAARAGVVPLLDLFTGRVTEQTNRI
jgi:hypothetical protein